MSALASIPSPGSGEIEVGPLTLHAYGFTLLVAIVAATALAGVLWTRRGGEWDVVFSAAMWGVAGGIVGARLYHVLTSWSEVPSPKWQGVFEVWEGGLGIWGGIAGGVLMGVWAARRAGVSAFALMDVVAPALLLAQAIGRWGNYWNQELFGVPTDRPWGLEIDPENRPERYADSDTFHPLFLYESLWSLLGVLVLLLVWRSRRVRPPGLFCLYVAWYTFGRFFLEFVRTDEAHELLGLRLNNYVALALFLASLAAFWWSQRRAGPAPGEPARPAPTPARSMAVPKGRVRPRR
ncbi:MAG: prolipoprotein diacylglyceryl transferase [Thermoleophilia bacterium]|nr:prolipoprotein diacylglyceryl transferase [Thermoleophilia bacterium]